MVEIVKYALILIAFINAAIVVVPYMLGKAELMTCRNFFLFGFTIYQVTSGVITIANPASYAPEITVSDQNAIAGQYLLWIIIFEIVFLACYRWGFGAKRLARFTPLVKGTPREPVLWIFAFALLGLALILRFTVLIPYVSVWTTHIGLSTAAVAAGLGAWIWVRRPLNPAAAALMFGVLIAALIINLAGFYGRRPIVAITGCLAWGTYYSRWRGLQPARVVLYAGVFGLIPVVLVAKYTAVRGQFQGTEAGGVARLTAMINADTKAGLMDLVSGQECAAWSMHLMEIYPEYYDYKHLHSIKYFVVFSVPRAQAQARRRRRIGRRQVDPHAARGHAIRGELAERRRGRSAREVEGHRARERERDDHEHGPPLPRRRGRRSGGRVGVERAPRAHGVRVRLAR